MYCRSVENHDLLLCVIAMRIHEEARTLELSCEFGINVRACDIRFELRAHRNSTWD